MNKELRNEIDMLQGNINRMCVTDDVQELFSMHCYAEDRLRRIFKINYKKLLDRKLLNEENKYE